MAATNLSMSNSTTVKATSTNACNGVVLRASDGIHVVTGWSVFANTQANPEGNGFTHCDLTSDTSMDRVSHGLSFGSTGRSGKPIAVNGISLGSALTGLQYPGLNFGKAGWKAIRTEWKAFLEGRPDMMTNWLLSSGFVFILPKYRDTNDETQQDYKGRDHLGSLFGTKASKGFAPQRIGKVTAAYDLGKSDLVTKGLQPWDAMEVALTANEASKYGLPETTTMGDIATAMGKRSGHHAIPYGESRGDDFESSVEAIADAIDFDN